MQPTTPLEPPQGLLVDTAWLDQHLNEPQLRILDVRGRHPSSALPAAKRAEFDTAHVPGAVFVDWTRDFVNQEAVVPYQLAEPDQFATDAAALGISDRELVVTYDDYYGIHAARVAWALRCYGLEARVLDGGWRTWTEEGHATTAEPTDVPSTMVRARTQTPLRLSLDDFERARLRGAVVVDARPRHLYLGEPGLAGTGHIPGALALPYQELVDGATGLFQSPAAIRRLVVAAGIDPDAPAAEVVATCGIGVSATVALIALELVGVRVSGVYDGAWTEWSADPARPVAYGQTPRSAAPHTLARNLSPAPAAVSPGVS